MAPRIRLYGLRHLRDEQAAADLVQQVLMMTIESLRAGKVRDPGKILERLALLNPGTLACMHGSAFQGDGAAQLRRLRTVMSGAEATVGG